MRRRISGYKSGGYHKMKGKSAVWIRICVLTAILTLFAACASGCRDHFFAAPPTLSVPTPNVTLPATGSPVQTPTATPDTAQEIHFTDISLENLVRDKLEKSIGPIRRADVEKITTLEARVQGIQRIDSLEYFTNLEELDLFGNRITDFSVLAKLPSLKKLNIAKNYNVLTLGAASGTGLDLTPLKNLVLLEELNASDNMLTDLTAIGSLSALKTLTLSNNRITDITPLSACKALTYVDLSHNYGLNSDYTERGITDLTPLFGNLKLRTLIASDNLIAKVDGIETLTELSYLDLTNNCLDSVESLAKLGRLETVLLHSNALTVLDPLKDNATIQTLDVSLNMISNFDVIRTMTALRTLGWDQNMIQDNTPIDEFLARIQAETDG